MDGGVPDVDLAVEMLDEWSVAVWARLADGLIQPTPMMSRPSAEALEAFQAWAAARSGLPKSLVEASVANLSRVVDDLSEAFDYEAESKDDYFIVRKWYRGSSQVQGDAEDFGVHVRLIHNLVLELIRAVNLVIARVQQAEPALFRSQPLATVAVGPDHALMQAPEYSAESAALPQPYPGLRAFPGLIDKQNPGDLGHHSNDTPRTRIEFDEWVRKVEGALGPGSPVPPAAELPLRLPPLSAGTTPSGGSDPVPGWLQAAWGIVVIFGVILTLLDRPWALGAAVGLVLVTARFHRQLWKWPPRKGFALLAITAAVVFGIIAQVISNGISDGGGDQSPGAGSETGTTGSVTPQADLRGRLEAFNATYGRRWGTAIDFDAQDELAFRLNISNEGDEDSPPLDLLPTVKEPPEGQPWVVEMFAGPPAALKPVPGASAVLRPQSRGVDEIWLRDLVAPAETEGREALPVDDSSWKQLGDKYFEGSTAYRLGKLQPGQVKVVTFDGSGVLPENTPYISGHIHFANQSKEHFRVTGSALPGERLKFHILLNNGGWKGIQTRIHVIFLPHVRRGFTVVKAYADLNFDEGNVVGESRVSSSNGGRVTLRVIPGTTSLWGHGGGSCEGELELLHQLPDGISQGGVDVGSVGGFRPRDPCIGSEFVRGVEFEAEVSGNG